MQDKSAEDLEPVRIGDAELFSAESVQAALGISRQTLWRWRQDGKIPPGYRDRRRRLFFTAEEFEAVRAYAFRIEPAQAVHGSQLSLLSGIRGGRS